VKGRSIAARRPTTATDLSNGFEGRAMSKMKVGMIGGGGPANFFGAPHRRAILMDNSAELAAGALRSNPDEALASAKELYFTRGYRDWKSLVADESKLAVGERVDYVTIVTPNDAHFGPAEAAAKAGIGVVCEKPLTMNLAEAKSLYQTVKQHKTPFVVAYTYTAFPMVMFARRLVLDGAIGEVRKVEAWYPQGWLASKLETEGQKQASWRVDPSKAGASGCGGDIGTHAYEFVRFVTGKTALRVQARLKSFVKGRALDDDFTVLAELEGDAVATIAASQITIGAQNDNGFRVSGTKGTIEWSITEHNALKHLEAGSPVKIYRLGAEYGYIPESIKPYVRVPSGHPEGFHEALANLHRTIEWTIRASRGEKAPKPFELPGIADGAAGMAFIEAAVASSKQEGAWVPVASIE
jgi:predicted dehydrogenase